MGFRKNYHGGRTYAADPDAEAGLAARLVSMLRGMFQTGTSSLDAEMHPACRNGSPYSLLGADDQEPFPSHSGRPVFPMADWSARPGASLRARRPAASVEVPEADHSHR